MQGQGTSADQPAVDGVEARNPSNAENPPARTATDDAALIPTILLDPAVEMVPIGPAEPASPETAATPPETENHPLFQAEIVAVPEAGPTPAEHHAAIASAETASIARSLLVHESQDDPFESTIHVEAFTGSHAPSIAVAHTSNTFAIDDQVGAARSIDAISIPFLAADSRGGGDVTGREVDPTMAVKNDATQGVGDGQPTGNIYLDAIIDGSRWTGGAVYYFFAEGDPNGDLGFNGHAWQQNDKDAFLNAIQAYENVCMIDYEPAANVSDANILWFKGSDSDLDGNLGWHDFPDGEFAQLYGAFNDDPSDWDATKLTPGGDAFDTIIHELGHGLGLAHPHDGGIETDATIFPGATAFGIGTNGLNQSIWTIMSYNPGWTGSPSHTLDYGQPLTPMAFDIAALQVLYGANTTFKNGSDTYLLPTANAAGTGWTCLWDTGGTDTISGASATKAVTIDLEAATLDPSAGIHAGGYVSWQTGIAGGFTIAKGVVIENAIGGSASDAITGNEKDNTLDGGDGNDTINGLAGDDTLDGGKGNDKIDGGSGGDDMTGGEGNDLFIVDDPNDTVHENKDEGTDTVKSSVDFDLSTDGANVEILILGAGALKGTGDDLANTITGNKDGNVLDGKGGADTMTGGAGEDIYIVDDKGDKVVEASGAANGTTDEVDSSISFSLATAANVEMLRLTGSADIDGTGSKNGDLLFGNSGKNTLDGTDGSDLLSDSSGGDDTLLGGKGNDTLNDNKGNNSLDGGDGNDIINASGATGNDTLSGGTGTDQIDDFGGNNAVDGGAGNDTIVMHAATGDDTILGGDGDDDITDNGGTNTIDAGKGNDKVTLLGGSDDVTGGDGNDAIFSFASTASTLSGNAGNDDLQSHNKVDTLDGGDGNDFLSSLAGSITMIGGKGNDLYTLTDGKETIVEAAGEGTDQVTSFVGLDFTKGSLATADIENIVFVNPDLKIVGNALNNVITDKSLGGSTGDQLFGGGGNDTITGGAGTDKLDGGTGNDSLTGGNGSDTYIVDSLADKVNEITALGGNADTVQSSINYSIAALKFVENLTLTTTDGTDTVALNGTGNALDNTLTGNDGDNVLDGGAGNDTYVGGKGNDTFILDNLAELALISNTGTDGVGSDTIKTAQQLTGFTGIAGVENYVNTGTKAWDVDLSGKTGVAHMLVGGTVGDTLKGADKDDTLDGGKGNDTLIGGDGDDTYVVDSLGDKVTEASGKGIDTVQTTMLIKDGTNFAEVENFTYTGTAAWTFTGNDGDNVITGGKGADKLDGGKGNDTLFGNDGNDTLDGGVGNDAMEGGKGNDTYIVDSVVDVVFENNGEGTDLIKSTVNIDLTGKQFQGEIENVTLVQDDANSLFPNKVVGNEFNNIIIGVDGHSGAGMSFSGGGGNDTLTGGALNDTLDGGTGNDTMTGGLGSDIYIVDSSGDKVVETSNAPSAPGFIDTVRSAVSFSLATLAFVENVSLTGVNGLSADTAKIDATGNALVNLLTGNDGDNILDGGKGADFFTGGKGNDTFVLDDAAELTGHIFEAASAGSDTIKTALQLGPGFTGIANVENYVNTGAKAWDIDLSGQTGVGHTLVGGAAADTLIGSDSGNYLDGGKGNDTLTGGSGADTFVIDSAGDKILGVIDSTDTLLINRTINLKDDATFGGIFDNGGLTGTATLNITGNGGANNLFGNDGANQIDGGTGGDAMAGGKGNDTYLVDDAGDTVTENPSGGIDTIKSTNVDIDLTGGNFIGEIENIILGGSATTAVGNDFNNAITGNDNGNTLSGGKGNDTLIGGTGADELDGGEGNDTMTGGKGDDIYHVDSLTDKIMETLTFAAGGGTDTIVSAISYSIAALANIDNLALTTDGTGQDTVDLNGTGNALNNTITGNDGDNILDGGKGDDTLIGGLGDDTYVFDSTKDTVNGEIGGHDLVLSSVSIDDLNDPNLSDINDVTLTGSAALNVLGGNSLDNHLTGNTGANRLEGGDGADTLDGGKGVDDLRGGDGNDTYVVDNIKDTVTENSGEGTHDLVQSSITYTLDANVEDLTLTGASAINGTGNDANNIITGNDGKNVLSGLIGDDTLIGGKGDDTMTGGTGADTFAYQDIADAGTHKDVITDFSKAEGDVLDVHDLFTGPGPTDVADAFVSKYLLLVNVHNDTIVAVDTDGAANGENFVLLTTLKGVTIHETDTASFQVT
jgi:Ca2+-binding RTX toxin-like protein